MRFTGIRPGRWSLAVVPKSVLQPRASDWPKRILDMQHIDVDEHFD